MFPFLRYVNQKIWKVGDYSDSNILEEDIFLGFVTTNKLTKTQRIVFKEKKLIIIIVKIIIFCI